MEEIILKPFQYDFVHSKARHPAFVGGWNTGKTMCAIDRARIYSKLIPDNLGIIFRKTFRSLQDSTLKDFEKYTGLTVDGERNLVDKNGSVTMFRHIDELESINQQNINLGWFYIEQGDELENNEAFFMLFGRLRRHLEPTEQFKLLKIPERSGWVIANAGDHWMRPLWKEQGLAKTQKEVLPDYQGTFSELIEATTWDNQEHAKKDFLDSLRILEVQNPSLYRQFVMNDWEVTQRNVVFTNGLIELMYARQELLARHSDNAGVAVDPAGEGPDDNVFMAGRGGEVLDKYKKTIMPPTEKALKAVEMCKAINGYWIIVDCDGLGIETAQELDNLPESYLQGIQIIRFHGSAPSQLKEGDRLLYLNLRTEAAFIAKKRGWAGRAGVSVKDTELVEELKADEYEERRGMLALIPKKDIKAILGGRSPGSADCWKMLQYAFDQEYKDNTYRFKDRTMPRYSLMDNDIEAHNPGELSNLPRFASMA